MGQEQEETFNKYLSMLGTAAGSDDAFHSLLELDRSWLPRIVAACQRENNPRRKSLLVQIIWRSKQPEIIGFLGRTLLDPEEKVWKEALTGLVAFKNRGAVQEINNAIQSWDGDDLNRLEWLKEALEQLHEDN